MKTTGLTWLEAGRESCGERLWLVSPLDGPLDYGSCSLFSRASAV